MITVKGDEIRVGDIFDCTCGCHIRFKVEIIGSSQFHARNIIHDGNYPVSENFNKSDTFNLLDEQDRALIELTT
jgi:hypothetical protein